MEGPSHPRLPCVLLLVCVHACMRACVHACVCVCARVHTLALGHCDGAPIIASTNYQAPTHQPSSALTQLLAVSSHLVRRSIRQKRHRSHPPSVKCADVAECGKLSKHRFVCAAIAAPGGVGVPEPLPNKGSPDVGVIGHVPPHSPHCRCPAGIVVWRICVHVCVTPKCGGHWPCASRPAPELPMHAHGRTLTPPTAADAL